MFLFADFIVGVLTILIPRIPRAYAIYIVGQLFLVGSTFLFNIIIARMLGPGEMGVWQTAVLFATYGMILLFGTLNGMGREVPYLLGRKDTKGVEESIATAFFVIAISIGLLAIFILFAKYIDLLSTWLLLGAGLLFARFLNSFSVMLLRSFQRFARLGMHQAFVAVVLLLGMLWIWGKPSLYRLLVVTDIALILASVFAYKFIHTNRFRLRRLWTLVQVGLPIMLAGFLFGLLTTVDRLLILRFLGTDWLGLYTPAIMAFGVLTIVPSMVSNLIYPKLAHEFGQNENVARLIPLVGRAMKINFTVTLACALLFLLIFYAGIIPYFLPAYLEGRFPMIIILLSAFFFPVAQSFGDLFNVVGWQKRYLLNMALGLLFSASFGYVFIGPAGLGLNGVAIGSVMGAAVFAAAQMVTYYKLLNQSGN